MWYMLGFGNQASVRFGSISFTGVTFSERGGKRAKGQRRNLARMWSQFDPMYRSGT
jgi:hypothetical protein